MSKQHKTLMILGIAAAFVPFLGVPYAWRQWILFVVGVCIVVIALILSSKTSKKNDVSETQL